MGKLVKNHWARLVVLIAAAFQVGGSIEAFFWPKVTWNFSTTSLDILVTPVPVLQVFNLGLGILVLAWEWPLGFLAGNMFHRSIHARLVIYTICAVSAFFLYQSHNSTFYYFVGIYGYALALASHETIYPVPWTVTPSNKRSTLRIYPDYEGGSKFDLRRTSKHASEKDLENDFIRNFKYGTNLVSTPSNPSPVARSPLRFKSPTDSEAYPLPSVGRRKDSSMPYNRMKSKAWHS